MSSSAELARALLRKAADDLYVVERLAADVNAPNWVLGFHAQQAVEKALKAVLSFHRVEFPRTHNLSMLLALLRRAGLPLPSHEEALGDLIPFGVAMRYEIEFDEDELQIDRQWALQAASRTIRWADETIASSGPGTSEQD